MKLHFLLSAVCAALLAAGNLSADDLTEIDAKSLQCRWIAGLFCKAESPVSIWQLTFCDNKGKEVCKVSGSDARIRSLKKEGALKIMTFDGIPLEGKENQLTVRVMISGDANANREFWRIEWNNRSSLQVQKVRFPVLTQVIRPGEGDVMFPIGNYGGKLLRNNRTSRSNVYPSFTGYVQLTSFTVGGKTLAVFTRDPVGLHKSFQLLPNQSYSVETEIPLNSKALPFDVEIALLDGNYLAAAKEYRAWAIQSAPWLKKGPLSAREDLPEEFFRSGPWFCMGWMPPAAMDKMVARAEAACGMPVSLHWYVWHKENFDTCYPELHPQPGFAEAVSAMQKRGNYIVPYVNGHIWDQNLPSYPKAKPFAAVKRNGEIAEESWGTPKHPFSVMCPGTGFYRDFLAEYAGKLMRESGLKGLYLDQISAVIPSWCYAKDHPHVPGPGTYWREGYAALLEKLQKQAGTKVALYSECAQEIHYDNISGNLCWSAVETDDIPLLPAIYSGYTTYFGSPAAEKDSFRAFAVIQQRAFLWGVQPGWSQAWLIGKKQQAKYLGMLGRLRLKLLPYLTFGEYAGEFPLSNVSSHEDVLNYTGSNGTVRTIVTPDIQTAVWKNQKGDTAFFFANSTALSQIVRGSVPCPPGKYTVKIDGIADHVISGEKCSIALPLSPYEVRYVELVPFTEKADNPRYAFFAGMFRRGVIVEELPASLLRTESAPPQIHWYVRNVTDKAITVTVNGKNWQVPAGGTTEIRQTAASAVSVNVDGETFSPECTPRILPDLEVAVESAGIMESESPIPLTVCFKNNTDQAIPLRAKLTLHKSWTLPQGSSFELSAAPGFSRIPVPAVSPKLTARRQFPGRLELRRDDKVLLSQRLSCQVTPRVPPCTAIRFASKPKIDGSIEEFKNCPEIRLTPQQNGKSSPAVFSGEKDCSAVVRLGYDDNFLYFAAEVTDDVQEQPCVEANLWKGDCIQISLLGKRNRKGGSTGEEKDFAMALTNTGSELYDFRSKEDFGEVLVLRKQGKTVYEAAIPWKRFSLSAAEKDMAISFVISDNDGTASMKGYLELTPGIFGTKDSSLYRPLELKQP